jgi:hypothetical protein
MVKSNFLDWILTDSLSCFPWFCRILDNLPVAVPKTIRNENGDTFSMFDRGFLIGGKDNEGKFFINNHLSFVIKYHEDAQLSTSRIVGFEVTPHRYVSLVHTIHYRMC